MIIRPGVPTDLPQVASLKVSSWDDTYRPLLGSLLIDRVLDVEEHRTAIQGDLERRDAFLLVAEASDGEVVGFALSYVDAEGEPFLESLHVRPRLRGAGIGAALLRATASRWAAAGFGSMSLHVLAANAAARRFYARYGGAVEAAFDDDWLGTPVQVVVYRWSDLVIPFTAMG